MSLHELSFSKYISYSFVLKGLVIVINKKILKLNNTIDIQFYILNYFIRMQLYCQNCDVECFPYYINC